eukprot:3917392-Amphidinium_carterae.1
MSDDFVCGVLGLDAQGAVDTLLTQPGLPPARAAKFWQQDEMHMVHKLFCPNWCQIIWDHSTIHELSGGPGMEVESGMMLKYIHSSYTTFKSMMAKGNLGQRFIFDSPMSAALHRTAHHHFELSGARINERGVMIVGLMMCEDYIASEGNSAQNGYSSSVNLNIKDVAEAKISVVSGIMISPTIIAELANEKTAVPTRQSMSHFESILEVNRLCMTNLVTPEILIALATPTPYSSKVRCTLATQVPELYERVTSLVDTIKQQGAQEEASETVIGQTTTATTIQINLQDGDEASLTVKKMKKC